MLSVALLSNSGSLDARERPSRWGVIPCFVQTRATRMWLTPRWAESLQVLQCVEPSGGARRVPPECGPPSVEYLAGKLARDAGCIAPPTVPKQTTGSRSRQRLDYTQSVTHGIPGRPRSPEQNRAGSPCIFGLSGPTPPSSGEFHTFTFRQDYRIFHEHDRSL